MAEGLMKKITGGDKIRARLLYQNGFEFDPTHKVLFASNHKPNVRSGADNAVWRRIRLIPFMEIIPDAERDTDLDTKLLAELPGILNWAVRGCLDWIQGGMRTPDAVKALTEEYKEESDVIGQFIHECCLLGPSYAARAHELYAAYAEWVEERGERPRTMTAFGRTLSERPGITKTKSSTTLYEGIGLAFGSKMGGK